MIDAVVIGAGLSGLVCARRLVAAGARVIVVEAQPRVGGRTLSIDLAGAPVDLGGAWLSVGQPRLAALADELGVETVPQFRDGVSITVAPRARRRLPGAGLFAALSLRRRLKTIERMSRAPDPALDRISLADWLARELRDAASRAHLAVHAELTFATDPAELSFLAYLAHLGATGGFGDPRDELPGGGRERRFVGGAQALSLRLAAGLGDTVRLDEPVRALDDDGARVQVTTARGEHVAARAVLTVPPSRARAIAITPALPAAAAHHAAASRPGAVVKIVLAYPRAFWREAGLSGEAYRTVGMVRAVVDLCEPGGGRPALLAFVVATEAARWSARDPDERRAALLAELVEMFGAEAGAPSAVVERDWSADPWSGGCVATSRPTSAADPGGWRSAHGRIHLAGTESAVAWPGYMEGAIEAGERAAAEVLGIRGSS